MQCETEKLTSESAPTPRSASHYVRVSACGLHLGWKHLAAMMRLCDLTDLSKMRSTRGNQSTYAAACSGVPICDGGAAIAPSF